MATSFPSSLDSFTNPLSSDTLSSPSHSAQHADANDAIEALQAKVGADSSAVTSSLDYKVSTLQSDVSTAQSDISTLQSDVAGLVTGKILQVVQNVKSDTFSTTSASLTNVTGLNVTITPSSATSKVLVFLAMGLVDATASVKMVFDVTRNGTPVGVGDPAAPRIQAISMVIPAAGTRPESVAWSYLDSPASTSALTYQVRCQTHTGTLYVNRTATDTGDATYGRGIATMIAMEVAA